MTRHIENAKALALGILILFSGTIEADPAEVIPDDLATTEPTLEEFQSIIPPSFMPEITLMSLFCDDSETLQANAENAGATLVIRAVNMEGTSGAKYYQNFLNDSWVITVLNQDDPTRECVVLMGGADTAEILIEYTRPESRDPCTEIHPELRFEDGKCSMPVPVPEYDEDIADPNEINRRKMEEELRELLNDRINGESHF